MKVVSKVSIRIAELGSDFENTEPERLNYRNRGEPYFSHSCFCAILKYGKVKS